MAAAIAELVIRRLRPAVTTLYAAAETVADPMTADRLRSMAAWTVGREALRLLELTQDLSVLVRNDGEIARPIRPVALAEVIGRRLAGYPEFEEGRLVIDVPSDLPRAAVDPGALEHAIGNLVRSALSNAPRDGRVTVRAMVAPGALRITVRDGGPMHHSRTSDPFALSPEAGRPIDDGSGMNLSLYVARRLVEALGGAIRAGQGPSGTELVVTLPI
ncbi:MAG: sensor histidine kinase [Candidatus Limnocylindrales bacterium]